MEIEDAFTVEAIEATGTNVEGEQEAELREVVGKVFQSNGVAYTRDHENLAVLCFVAGRTYQVEGSSITVPVTMTPEMMVEFLEFLVQKLGGRHDAD